MGDQRYDGTKLGDILSWPSANIAAKSCESTCKHHPSVSQRSNTTVNIVNTTLEYLAKQKFIDMTLPSKHIKCACSFLTTMLS
jgi:hypothetical protein